MKYLIIKILLILTLISCDNSVKKKPYSPIIPTTALSDCGNGRDYDIYQLNEKYFSNDDVLTLKLKIVYFMNGVSEPIDTKSLKNRIVLSNRYFKDAKIAFKFNGVEYIEGKPENDSLALNSIKSLETIVKERRDDLRGVYHIEHFDFWHTVYGEEGTMIAYIYDNVDSGYAGVAGGIGSTYFAIRAKYINPQYHTWEHELGHDLGLYHTHEPDDTDGLNNSTGDMVCDTYASIDTLIQFVDDSCCVKDNCPIPNEYVETLITNIMSYTRYECRAEFSPVQNNRKRKIIETNADLRRTIEDYDKLTKRTWENLKKVQ